MYRHPVRTGLAFIGAGLCAAAAAVLIGYGAIVTFEDPLEVWYRKRNH